MAGIFVDNNQTVLYGIPSRPPDFLNISGNGEPGVYIMGHDKFLLKDFHVVGILRRSVGPSEEFLLGILSVFLIAVLSEIVHIYLMRTSTQRHLTASSVFYACLVDELSHFRNIWLHISSVRRRRGNDRQLLTGRQQMLASLVVVTITLGLFTAEVVAVVLTQPIMVSSSRYEYNIRGVQPTGASRGVARVVRRVAGDRTCVSPIMTRGNQRRNYMVGACSILETNRVLDGEEDVSTIIEVGSWYHYGGSDYSITFGDAFFKLRLRAEVFLDADMGGARKIFFENRDNDSMDHARYVQERFIYSSMEWVCNKDFSEKSCEELVAELRILDSSRVTREILLWRGKREDVKENITGLVTRFEVRMNAPWRAMNSGIREMYASAALTEVTGPVVYQNVLNDTIEDGIPGLISEEGRVAGVILLLVIFCVMLIGLFVFRSVFKPISIAHIAMRHFGDDTEIYFEPQESSDFSWDPRVRGAMSPERRNRYFNWNAARANRPNEDVESLDGLSRPPSVSTWESVDR